MSDGVTVRLNISTIELNIGQTSEFTLRWRLQLLKRAIDEYIRNQDQILVSAARDFLTDVSDQISEKLEGQVAPVCPSCYDSLYVRCICAIENRDSSLCEVCFGTSTVPCESCEAGRRLL